MKLHEYQAKELLKKAGIPIQEGIMVESPAEAVEAAKRLYPDGPEGKFFVIKAQIHAGGRGKGVFKETGIRGVMVAKSLDEVKEIASKMLGYTLVTKQTGNDGKKVNKILVAQDAFYPGPSEPKEYYLSITLDRSISRDVIIASSEGGMDIEEVAEQTPEKIAKEWIDPLIGLRPFQAMRMGFRLGLPDELLSPFTSLLLKLYHLYKTHDASLIELNPLLKTSDNQLIAVDAKIDIEDNALFRHPDLENLRDLSEEDPLEVEAKNHHLNYIKLDGNVGCMVNGAGLAMATMDLIKLYGGEPANFLDVGGTANAERVEAALRIILKDPNVKLILVNIFGGIVQCDRVANGIVQAYKKIGEIPVPMIIRLQGTNAEKAKQIIAESGLKVIPVTELKETAEKVKEVLATVK
jgi:succinyl-CoA synthetase beta subunit